MAKFVLHIGSDKTGTSHIQRFMARNLGPLKERGWVYPKTAQTKLEASGKILSGNGYELFQAAQNGPRQITQVLERFPKTDVVISSEALCALDANQLKQISNLLVGLGFSPIFVFYVRAPIDYFVSGVIQWAKRNGGVTHPQAAVEHNVGQLRGIGATNMRRRVDNLVTAVGFDRVNIRHFSQEAFVGGELISDFLSVLDVSDLNGFHLINGRTNPALSEQSLELLIAMNLLSRDGELSAKVSDAMMRAQEELPGTAVKLPLALLTRAAVEFDEDIEYLKEKFGLTHLEAFSGSLVKRSDVGGTTSSVVDVCAATLRNLVGGSCQSDGP